ncbi:iron complex transport system permease protein [Cohaesibacter sp. ES.047]|uniref:FecCD family ABC transporter permease n=1 Tax=Cohaesibacter sp. ES.047 TaxID=1798205 RepID=UPI000BB6D8CC|nr:iron ABC transporter permease [Cohaesibacter sp. ES.047]SNY91276.1 iron complex transport system permease protein [Cohaesibacter sp. ES.047]
MSAVDAYHRRRLHQRVRRLEGDRGPLARLTMGVLLVALILVAAASLTVGASGLGGATVVDQIRAFVTGAEPDTSHFSVIFWDIRLPRMVLAILVGASLASAGAVMQGLFRNPLADPGIVGISSGAVLFAVIAIVLGGTVLAPVEAVFGIYMLPLFAFVGGAGNTLLLYVISTRHGQTSVATMLLSGIAINALMLSFIGYLTFISDDQQLRDLTFWSMGSLGGANWVKIQAILPFILLSLALMPLLSNGLDGLVLGDHQARHMGVPVQALKRLAIFGIALSVGASVAVTGGIGFVGLVVPHLLRLLIGPDHRYLLPTSALLGAILLLLADMVARTAVAPASLPIGIVTAAIGGPFFLWLVVRSRGILS